MLAFQVFDLVRTREPLVNRRRRPPFGARPLPWSPVHLSQAPARPHRRQIVIKESSRGAGTGTVPSGSGFLNISREKIRRSTGSANDELGWRPGPGRVPPTAGSSRTMRIQRCSHSIDTARPQAVAGWSFVHGSGPARQLLRSRANSVPRPFVTRGRPESTRTGCLHSARCLR